MHYYQFNIADYRKNTMHLTPIEHYIYRTLRDWYLLDEEPLPKKTQVVMRRLSLGNEHLENLQNVLNDFFFLEEKGWVHPELDVIIYNYHATVEKNRENGRKGGRPKKQQDTENGKPKKTQSVPSGNPSESQKKPNQEPVNHKPITNNHKPSINTSNKFDGFWNLYPKKTGRKPCLAKWKARKLDSIADQIIRNVKERIENDQQWLDGYIPNPLTFINQDRWEDEISIKAKDWIDELKDDYIDSTTEKTNPNEARVIEFLKGAK